MILAGALGAFAGDNISYAIGRFIGRPAQERFLNGDRAQRALAWARGTARQTRRARRHPRPLRARRPHGCDVHRRADPLLVPALRRLRRDRRRHLGDVRLAARLLRRPLLRAPRLGGAAARVRDRGLRHARGRGHQAAAPHEPPRRTRRRRTSSSTRTTRSTGTRGATRRSRARATRTGRSCSRSATPRATGAT